MSFYHPEEERLQRQMVTSVLCTTLGLKLCADEMRKAGEAFEQLKTVADYHEIRRLPRDVRL